MAAARKPADVYDSDGSASPRCNLSAHSLSATMDFSSFVSGNRAAAPAGAVVRTGPEPVRAQVFTSQIVQLFIPHNTPRSRNIRLFIASYCLNGRNERVFIFRQANGAVVANWTTVALESRADAPRLTMGPVQVCEMLINVLGRQCPDVSTVSLFDEQNNAIELEHVRTLQFRALPTGAIGPGPAISLLSESPQDSTALVTGAAGQPLATGIVPATGAGTSTDPVVTYSSEVVVTAPNIAAEPPLPPALGPPMTPWEQEKGEMVSAMDKIKADTKAAQDQMEDRLSAFQTTVGDSLAAIMAKLDGSAKGTAPTAAVDPADEAAGSQDAEAEGSTPADPLPDPRTPSPSWVVASAAERLSHRRQLRSPARPRSRASRTRASRCSRAHVLPTAGWRSRGRGWRWRRTAEVITMVHGSTMSRFFRRNSA